MDEKKKPDPWATPETDEKKTPESGADAWDATQWHEVKKGETLWKIAEQY
jgi:LysM repeat protein